MSLLSGTTVLGSFEVNKAAGFSNTAFKSAALDLILPNGSPLIGGPLAISLQGHSGAGDQVMVDNVALNFTAAAPVPLPASGLLLTPVLLGLGRLARRKARV
jgi:hypothetical protein